MKFLGIKSALLSSEIASFVVVMLAAPGAAFATPTFYTLKTAFDAAAGTGLTTEDFENLTPPGGSFAPCPAALNSTTDPSSSFCWDAGDVVSGFSFDNNGVNRNGGELITVDAGGNGTNTSKYISTNFFADTARVTFSPGVDAVSFDLLSLFSASTVNVSVFNTTGGLLGSTSVSASKSGTFFGVIDNMSLIGSITMFSTSNQDEGIDNLAFGLVSTTVPEPLTGTILGIGLVGVLVSRRRRKA